MDSGVIVFIFCIFAFLFIVYYSSYITTKRKKHLLNLKQEKNATLFIALNHHSGLPVAENVLVQIFSCPAEYEFLASNNSFKLDKSKITDITITNNIDQQKSHVSSVGGAVGGALLFGPVGAMIGGRSKEKTSTIVKSYLVFTFLDNNEIKNIIFNCADTFNASKFVKEFQKNKSKSSTSINL